MLVLQFTGEKERYDVEFKKISNTTVEISGAPAKTKGFYLSRKGHADKWDYRDYNTIYKEEDGIVVYSNNGTVCI